jgi:hypothetical protein
VPNVAAIIKEHVTLEVRCIDRLYLNAHVPRLQTSGGVIDSLVRVCRQKIPSPAVFGQLTDAFKTRLRLPSYRCRPLRWSRGSATDTRRAVAQILPPPHLLAMAIRVHLQDPNHSTKDRYRANNPSHRETAGVQACSFSAEPAGRFRPPQGMRRCTGLSSNWSTSRAS